MDVGLGSRGDIAAHIEGAAHDDNVLDENRDVWIVAERQRQIGHAADGDDGHFARICADRVDDEAMGRTRIAFQIDRFGNADIAEAVIAMNEGRPIDMEPQRVERFAQSPGDGRCDIPLLLQIKCVARRCFDRGIAENGGNADQVNVRMVVQETAGPSHHRRRGPYQKLPYA